MNIKTSKSVFHLQTFVSKVADDGLPTQMSIHCGGYFSARKLKCRANLHVAIEVLADEDAFLFLLDELEWTRTVVTPMDSSEVVFDHLCPNCSKRLLHPMLLAEARRMRQQKMENRRTGKT
jgi:hypothetical protein